MSNEERKREHELQQQLFERPSLIPGFKGSTAAMEVPLRRAGHPDLVLVNAAGQIAIVECKRAANPESRRWVIGQVLEYAAALWKLDYSDFERIILAASGRALTQPFKGSEDWDEKAFRDAVTRNLEAGDFRLFIAVDVMTERLKKRLERTVTFLHHQLSDRVTLLVLEVSRDGRVVVYGEDLEKVRPLKPKLKPDRWTLMDEMLSPRAVAVAEQLFSWADERKPRGVEVSCKATQCAVQAPQGPLFRLRSEEVQVSLSAVTKKGEPWDEPTKKLVGDLKEIGVMMPRDRPRAPLELLADDHTRERFLALMERHLDTLTG